MNCDTRFSVFENRLSTTFFLSPPPPPLSRFPRAHRPRKKEHLSRADGRTDGRTGRSSRTGPGNWDDSGEVGSRFTTREQNRTRFEKVLACRMKSDGKDRQVLLHHHRSESVRKHFQLR